MVSRSRLQSGAECSPVTLPPTFALSARLRPCTYGSVVTNLVEEGHTTLKPAYEVSVDNPSHSCLNPHPVFALSVPLNTHVSLDVHISPKRIILKELLVYSFQPMHPINAYGAPELQLHIPTALPPRKMFLVPSADKRVGGGGGNPVQFPGALPARRGAGGPTMLHW